jgi:hypothetical protein
VCSAGLHLRGGPVDRVNLGPGTHAAEEIVGGTAVVVEERVALDVIDGVTVPRQGLFAVEVPPDNQTATAAQLSEGTRRHLPGFDVGVVDDRPDGLAALARRRDLRYAGLDLALDDTEHLAHRPARGRDTRAEGRLDLPDGARQIGRR